MLVQIYEVSSPEEANALAGLGVDHIGVLVGDGSFPRERTIDDARLIFSAIPSSSKGLALLLSSDERLINIHIRIEASDCAPWRVDRSGHAIDGARPQEAMWPRHRDAKYSGGPRRKHRNR